MSATPPNFPPQPPPGPYGQQPPAYGAPLPPRPGAPQPGTIPLAQQTLGSVYSGGWRTVKQNTGAMLGQPSLWYTLAALALSVPFTVWMVRIFDYIWQLILVEESGRSFSPAEIKASIQWILQDMVLWVGAGALLYSVLVLIGTAITIAPTMRAAIGLPTSAGQAWRLLKPALPRIVVAGLVSWAASVAMMILVSWLSYVWIGSALDADYSSTQAGTDAAMQLGLETTWLSLLGYVLQIGLTLLIIRFIFVLPAMVLEGKGLFAALGRSWNLIKGRYWQVLGTLILGSLIVSFVLGIVLTVLIMIIMFAGAFSFDPNNIEQGLSSMGIWMGVSTFISTAFSLIAMFFLLPVAVLTYVDTRIRKENLLDELIPVALHDPTIAAARNGDQQALALTADYVPGRITHDGRSA